MDQQRNLFIAIAISVVILIGFQFFLAKFHPAPPPPTATSTAAATKGQAPGAPGADQATIPALPATSHAVPREQALATSPRIAIATPRLKGSINLVGARIDDLTLTDYRETVDPKSPQIVLLAPDESEHPYYMQFGWVAGDPNVKVPSNDTRWTASGGALSQDHPVDLSWDNGAGLKFTRRYAIDADYMFTITESVANSGTRAVALHPYGFVRRIGDVPVSSTYLLHEGPIGVFNGTLQDSYKYSSLKPEQPDEFPSTGGWMGITDKYWLTALIPPQDEALKGRFSRTERDHVDVYQVDYTGAEHEVAPGGTVSTESRVFAGAKTVALLDRYESQYSIPRFDRAIDFGWFYWITKPIFLTLDYFYTLIGNFGLAIMALTVVIKLIFFPLANKSYRAMSKMKKLQPEMQKLREKFGDDKEKMNKETMALYKRVGANPMAGCLPILIQIPVFFSLYKVLYVTIEMRQAPFYGWIHDLSAPDPTTFVNLFGLLPITPPEISFLHIGAWPLIMGVTMFLQQKLNPQPPDPIQAKMFMILPVVFTFMLSQFAAGLVIYWSWNNLLSIAQQWVIMRRAGAA
jgi:YidC/Oxa1 family membrane protein insertase